MTEITNVTEDDLHAYADGLLDEGEHARVETYLAGNPDASAMVADWQSQNDELRAAFAGSATRRDGDPSMVFRIPASANARHRRPLVRFAAACLLLVAGGAVGYFLPHATGQPAEVQTASLDGLPQQARNAFLIYASEVRHPVEVFANEETHLATWLGKRLAIDKLRVPDLKSLGFKLVGGRLLPIDGKPGAMFMYEDGSGERLTVLLGRNRDNKTTSFRFASADKVETFYWIDGELGYAVTGEVSRDLLRQVAEECYRQFPS